MDREDPVEMVVSFAIGAILGIGATLLLRPEPALPRRVARQIGDSGKRLGRRARRATRGAEEIGGALAAAGREVLDQFRGEVAEVVSAAREQLAEDVYAELRGAHKQTRGEGRRWHSRGGRH